MGNIYLSEKYGVNPCILKCPQCGEDSGSLSLLGRAYKYRCMNHGCDALIVSAPGTKPRECPKCLQAGSWQRFQDKEYDGSKPLLGNLCDKCIKLNEESKKIVDEGGIFWKCSHCHSRGAIVYSHPLAKKVREQLKMEPPKPAGIEFNQNDCPICTGQVQPKEVEGWNEKAIDGPDPKTEVDKT